MSVSKVLIVNIIGLSWRKYLTFFILLIIISILVWLFKKDLGSVFVVAGFFLVLIISTFLLELVGYYKQPDYTRKISTSKIISGFIVGLVSFIVAIILFKLIMSIFG